MKMIFIVLLFVVISAGRVFSQENRGEQVKARLLELFELCRNDDYQNAASFIVYRGSDESRRWKDVYHYNDETEISDVKRECKQIKSYLVSCDNYDFTEFKTERESEGLWCIWTLTFRCNSIGKVYFAFLDINGNYALGDID